MRAGGRETGAAGWSGAKRKSKKPAAAELTERARERLAITAMLTHRAGAAVFHPDSKGAMMFTTKPFSSGADVDEAARTSFQN
jgi:hypothetical protein